MSASGPQCRSLCSLCTPSEKSWIRPYDVCLNHIARTVVLLGSIYNFSGIIISVAVAELSKFSTLDLVLRIVRFIESNLGSAAIVDSFIDPNPLASMDLVLVSMRALSLELYL